MKKLVLIFATLIAFSPAFADDFDGGLWDNFGDINFYNSEKQTAVSDEQFDETVEKVKSKKRKPLFGPKEPKKMKGESYQQSNETELIKGITKETPVLRIPYELKTMDGGILPIGHYQAEFEKDDNGYVTMKLYQAHYMIAQYPAQETEEDLYDEHINYLTLEDFDENKVKINYGSMDFNAFAIVERK